MRQLALIACVLGGGGCSILYNSGGIPGIVADAAPDIVIDAPFDGNPSNLTLTDASPGELLEGQGDDGSAPAILVIQGTNFVTGAQVSLTAGSTVLITVDNGKVRIPPTGDYLAVPVTVHVDALVPDAMVIPLTIQVTQPVPGGGTTMQMLTGKLSLHGLDELTAIPANLANLKPLYSRVLVPTSGLITLTGTQSTPVLIRAVASIKLGTVSANADVAAKGGNASGTSTAGVGGPGGCTGGIAAATGNCAGAGVGGQNSTLLGTGGSGGGAGFSIMGTTGGGTGGGAGGPIVGDPMISTYSGAGTTANLPAGGGGGGQGTLSGASAGGGGGGVVELTAGGDVTVGAVDVSGGNGSSGGSMGGGGAGGIIMVRAGRTLTTGMLTSLGGNNASPGRIRWDAPTGTAPAGNPTPVRGPAFVSPPSILSTTDTTFNLIGTTNSLFDVYTTDAAGVKHNGTSGSFAADSTATITPTLSRGYNRVCITVRPGAQGTAEADKCVDVAYLP